MSDPKFRNRYRSRSSLPRCLQKRSRSPCWLGKIHHCIATTNDHFDCLWPELWKNCGTPSLRGSPSNVHERELKDKRSLTSSSTPPLSSFSGANKWKEEIFAKPLPQHPAPVHWPWCYSWPTLSSGWSPKLSCVNPCLGLVVFFISKKRLILSKSSRPC